MVVDGNVVGDSVVVDSVCSVVDGGIGDSVIVDSICSVVDGSVVAMSLSAWVCTTRTSRGLGGTASVPTTRAKSTACLNITPIKSPNVTVN